MAHLAMHVRVRTLARGYVYMEVLLSVFRERGGCGGGGQMLMRGFDQSRSEMTT